jgi:HAE1 family hydrophobic/amphiphilic exporter-1
MILSDTAIRRPVLTTMGMAAIVVFGLVSFRGLGIDLFPRVEFPVITILSVLPGADPETVETTVTDPIEEAVSNISGIKNLRSTSTDSVSQVVVEFVLEKNVDVAYQEVQAKLGTIRKNLPKDLEDPAVEKFDVDSSPILIVGVAGDLPVRELTDVADKVVKQRLQRIRNVGQVSIVGGRDRQIWVWLDRQKLEGYHLSVQDVMQALRTEHVEYPGGRVEDGAREWLVKTKAEFESAGQFESMVLAYRDGAPVTVRDVGRVEDGMEEERSLARLDETRMVALQVRRQSGTNTVEVATALKKEIERLKTELKPRGIRLEIGVDLSVFIEHSVEEVEFHMLYGGGMAILIVFFFLRNLRSTFVSSLVLPVAVIGTFSLMAMMGFTLNVISLMALSLAIGLLIDDSIVVQENTMRHVEEGMPARQAASFATNEIALAVLATTLSVCAVFVPVAFMKGMIGRFFYQFGLTVTFAVMISLLVAFTLDPMISSRILRKPRPGGLYAISERFFSAIDAVYEAILRVALRWRWATVALAVAAFVGAGYVAKFIRKEFIPQEDQSEFNVRVRAPLGASLSTTEEIIRQVRQRLAGQPWLAYQFTTIGADELKRVNEGSVYVRMLEKGKRKISQKEAMGWARDQVSSIQGARIRVEEVPRVSGGGFRVAEVQMEVRGRDLETLENLTGKITQRMQELPGYVDVDTSFERGKPELDVQILRDRAADLGVSPLAVASTIKALVGGEDVTKFRAQGDRYDVTVRLRPEQRTVKEDISRLKVRNARGELVHLENVARVREGSSPVQIDRFGRSRQITILANLKSEQKVLGEAVDELSRLAVEAGLPAGYSIGFVGKADIMQESFVNLIFALVLAVVMTYMVLAAQFESFVHPFTIMLSLPLSVIGALGALVAGGQTMSIFTMIGIIMLMGLVTKNGILLVDYTNTLRRRDGMERNAAVLKAGPVRLRPILMTTFAVISGMLPVALGTGAGSESRGPMAVAVIGGLVTSTLLTLVVVPVVYTLLDDLGRLFTRSGKASS